MAAARASLFRRYERNSVVLTSSSLEGIDLLSYENEIQHKLVYTRSWLYRCIRTLPDIRLWNAFMCIAVLGAIVLVITHDLSSGTIPFLVDIVYNFLYLLYVAGFALNLYTSRNQITLFELFTFAADAISYVKVVATDRVAKLLCYVVRLNRPLQYLWNVNDFAMKGSVVGTTFKWLYMFLMARVIWTVIRLLIDMVMDHWKKTSEHILKVELLDRIISRANFSDFQTTYYAIDKMYIPLGSPLELITTADQLFCMIVTTQGCLMVTGAAVASLSLVFSIYMMPEEAFRARYRLIMKELISSHIHDSLRAKVETFYMMYWKKQQAVSSADLLTKLPPSLRNEIYTDIYFEAIQKSKILRDLPNYFITEIAKCMTTIHYIPGDTIIQRKSNKSNMYYITYGDVALLTAEDDLTTLLRFCRGTVLTPSAVCTVVACSEAHVEIQAATFCTAYVLRSVDLWKKALKQNMYLGMATKILNAFDERLEKFKNHYMDRYHPDVKYLSSIAHFRAGLAWLKETKTPAGRSILEHHIFLEIADAYVMRNDYDVCATERSDPICLRTTFPCILQPTSSLLTAWNIVVTFFAAVVCFTHPYYMAFKPVLPAGFLLLDYVATVIFTLDMIVNLSTGANVEEGQTITITQTASHQMRSPRFIFDALAVAPMFTFFANGHYSGINKLIKIPKSALSRCGERTPCRFLAADIALKDRCIYTNFQHQKYLILYATYLHFYFDKMFSFLKSLEEDCVYFSHIIRFLTYTLLVFITCFFLSTLNQAVMCFMFEMCEVGNLTHPPHWNHGSNFTDDTLNIRVFFNLYWSISLVTLTNHMTTFDPSFWQGVLYTILIIEGVMLHHIFIEAVYSATIMVTSAMKEDFSSSIRAVKTFMIRNSLNPIISKRFCTYVQLCWYTDQAYSISHKKKSIFFDLPPHVYQDIIARQNLNYIKAIPFMKFVKKQELRYMASNTKLFYTSPNEILLNTGDMTNEIYVLKQGMCEMVCPITKKVIMHLKSKSHFGVPECLLRVPAFYTIRAVTHVQVFSIKQRHIKSILNNPAIKDTIEFTKSSREFANVMKHHQKPFMTYEPLPSPPNRAIFRMPKKYELDNVFQLPFRQFGLLLQPLRYISPRFTVRPDGKYLRRYEWFRAFCAFSCAMLFPSYTYLSIQFPGFYYVKLLLDVAAYFDMLQRFLVGYYNSEGILVYHPASTSAHYIKTAFLVDLLACIPLETLQISYSNRNQVYLDDQLLMLNRLLQLYRFFMTLESLSEYVREDVLLMLKYIPLFISLCNVLTSCVVLHSVYIYIPDNKDAAEQWQIAPVEMRSFNTESWVIVFPESYRFNLTESPWNIHLAAYFWVISECTTTGYKSVLPTNEYLMKILFLGMLINKMSTTYFAVSVISCRSNVNRVLCKFQEDLRDLKKFTSQELLHSSLQRKILKYYAYNWEKMGGVNSRTVLKMCCQVSLRTDTILQIYGPTFYECPILTHSDASLLRILSRGIYDLHFLHDTEIITEDDVISHMYFINMGTVTITGTFSENFLSANLSKGSIFGNLDRGRIRIPMMVRATTKVHILQIDSNVFHEIIRDFPLVGQLMDRYRPNKECFISASAAGTTTSDTDVTKSGQKHDSRLEYNDYKLWTKHPIVLFYLISVSLAIIFLDAYHAGFQNIETANLVVLYVLDFLFALKIAVLLYVPLKKSSKHRANSLIFRKKYIKKGFIWDFLSVLPLELFCILAPVEDRMFWFSWLRLNRLLRIPTVYKSLAYFGGQMSINIVATTIVSVTVYIAISMHMISCVWWYISIMEERDEAKSSWRYDNDGSHLCEDEYICSLFFMLTTLTHAGAGKILPRRQSEILFMIFIMLISTVVYMMYVGEFSNITQYTNFRLFAYYKQYLELKNYLSNNRVSANLLYLVNRYALHLWRQSRGEQFPYFLKKAPPPLKLKIMSAIYHHHLDQHPVFKNCEPAFLRQVVGCFNVWAFVDEMNIVREHEINDTMYFIHRGTVKETSEGQSEDDFKVYKPGEYFGEGLVRNTPFTNSYETITASQILTLRLDDWEYLLKFYPKSRTLIYGDRGLDDDTKPCSSKPASDASIKSVYSNVSKTKTPETPVEYKEDRSRYKRRETLQLSSNKRHLSKPEELFTPTNQAPTPALKKEDKEEKLTPKTDVKNRLSPPRKEDKPEEKASSSRPSEKAVALGASDTTLTPFSEGATWAREEDKLEAIESTNLVTSVSQVIPGNFFSRATSIPPLASPEVSQTRMTRRGTRVPTDDPIDIANDRDRDDTDDSDTSPSKKKISVPKFD